MARFIGILAKSYIVTLCDVAVVTSAVIAASHLIARATGWKRSAK